MWGGAAPAFLIVRDYPIETRSHQSGGRSQQEGGEGTCKRSMACGQTWRLSEALTLPPRQNSYYQRFRRIRYAQV